MSHRSRRHAHLIVGALAATSILAVGTISSPSVSAAATNVQAGGMTGLVGVDYGTGSYASYFTWNTSGGMNTACPPAPFGCTHGGANARYEFYPNTDGNPDGTYDPWAVDVGGIHVDSTGANVMNLGDVTLPR